MRLKTYIFLIIAIIFIACTNVNKNSNIYETGVSYDLAKLRSSNIKSAVYNLQFNIPNNKDSCVLGNLSLEFNLNKSEFNLDLPIDFKESNNNIISIYTNGKKSKYLFRNEHIIIPIKELNNGHNKIDIQFIAGEQSLNRNPEYNYTLLVPDRARTLFPCFDQPNLKANYNLSLTIPSDWEGIANSPCIDTIIYNNNKTLKFATTEPLSTYLFSFVSGVFNKSKHNNGERDIIIYHRETDKQKTNQLDDIANEVFSSIKWLEDYTSIKYPFAKYDMIILPGFQYGGMEHTGATLYNDKTIFLPSSPTLAQQLSRAQLIAHETAHMWFGDYVTMDWFSGVWIKEVFANFFAAQICRPLFPRVDFSVNDLSFYSSSYAEDRTDGTNSIEQYLPNLKYAGLIYGNIIYQKSPVVMNMLYELYGPDNFRSTIQEYLSTYAYSNASWDDFVEIMAKNKPAELDIEPKEWSEYWIYGKGMPHIKITENGLYEIDNSGQTLRIDTIKGYFIPNLDGKYYGYIEMIPSHLQFAMENLYKQREFEPLLAKKTLLMLFYENWLNGNIDSKVYLSNLFNYLNLEQNPQIVPSILGYIGNICSKEDYFISDSSNNLRLQAEQNLIKYINNKKNSRYAAQAFRSLNSLASSNISLNYIYSIWDTQKTDINLNDRDYTAMAYQLGIKLPILMGDNAPMQSIDIIKKQRERLKNADEIREYDFISRAAYYKDSELDSLFNSLLIAENRRIEPWAASLLGYINHPIRSNYTIKYIYPGLEILPKIQATGDIFFPKRWCSALLGGHNSKESWEEVKKYIINNDTLLPLLKNKLLQSSYHLKNYN